jgi:hypothetical protein
VVASWANHGLVFGEGEGSARRNFALAQTEFQSTNSRQFSFETLPLKAADGRTEQKILLLVLHSRHAIILVCVPILCRLILELAFD